MAAATAGAGEILVSRTVRDLVVGSGTGFEDRGSVELRGVPGSWQLLAVDRDGARAGSAEAELASTPTPSRRIAMRRSDRAVEVMARRTPWILRGWPALPPPPVGSPSWQLTGVSALGGGGSGGIRKPTFARCCAALANSSANFTILAVTSTVGGC